ncbi:MAG: DUF4297 domain-containing protein [Burkholderiales bacterium]|nr:DUF4297 domain-containing protein [Burkholderiales bacterium]
MTSIHDVPPREVVGRDTTLRFSMQHQAAAFAALEVLEGRDVDRVYCDYHDDFVVRHKTAAACKYHFFQVKTKNKKNHQWTLGEVFALRKGKQKSDKDSLLAIKKSFAGKLLIHSLTFRDACHQVTLLTNVNFTDEVENAVKELQAGKPSANAMCFLIDKLGEIFEVDIGKDEAVEIVKKLSLLSNVTYIGEEQTEFAVAAREAIHRYSEIDLEHHEASEIAAGLVSLVKHKSIASLCELAADKLDGAVSIGLDDLLAILSISPEAYRALVAGGDDKALKTASFIQRKLKVCGATDEMIEFASQQKVQWDIWLRTARHTYAEFDLTFLLQRVDELRAVWLKHGGELAYLHEQIEAVCTEPRVMKFSTLSKEVIAGGVIAAWVRRECA